jgi:hypothetical protein
MPARLIWFSPQQPPDQSLPPRRAMIGHPVSLRDAIPGLDPRNLETVTTAIRHAAGHRP